MKKIVLLFVVLTASFSIASAQSNLKEINSSEEFENLLYDDDSSDRLLAGDRPIVLDFTATWCPPCQAFKPKFKKAAEAFVGEVDFYTVDFDKNPELVEIFKIKSIPTLIFIPVTGAPSAIVGAPADVDEFIEAVRDTLL